VQLTTTETIGNHVQGLLAAITDTSAAATSIKRRVEQVFEPLNAYFTKYEAIYTDTSRKSDWYDAQTKALLDETFAEASKRLGWVQEESDKYIAGLKKAAYPEMPKPDTFNEAKDDLLTFIGSPKKGMLGRTMVEIARTALKNGQLPVVYVALGDWGGMYIDARGDDLDRAEYDAMKPDVLKLLPGVDPEKVGRLEVAQDVLPKVQQYLAAAVDFAKRDLGAYGAMSTGRHDAGARR